MCCFTMICTNSFKSSFENTFESLLAQIIFVLFLYEPLQWKIPHCQKEISEFQFRISLCILTALKDCNTTVPLLCLKLQSGCVCTQWSDGVV